MLRITQNTSAAGAMSYYTSENYYTDKSELVGLWRGEGAKRLGLLGEVTQDTWNALCNNRHPATGATLTLRQKEHRRVGYDFTFNAPKSLSLLYGLTKDERILQAFRESVHETMQTIESDMKTRVRKRGKNEERTTGNMTWGEFIHFSARPVEGIADPHLHAHCFVQNVTYDKIEKTWKAGDVSGIKRDGRYFEAMFHARLTRRLGNLGLATERTKTGWELAGIPKTALAKFSRRTNQIEAEAKRKGIHDPVQKSLLGAATRKRKQKHLTFGQLQTQWQSRLSAGERAAILAVSKAVGRQPIGEDARAPLAAVHHAAQHWFERMSVVPERTVLAEAMRQAVGKASPEAVEAAFRQYDLVFGEKDGRRMVTTRDVLSEEMRMIDFARSGRGVEAKLGSGSHVFKRDWLNGGQRRAVLHVLGSRDRVIMVRGAAGVGKTTMMQEAVEAIEAKGKHVFTFAPSADASRGVLRSEGFEKADTVAKLLADERLHPNIQGQVIWIDEAGLLGTKTMAKVFELAEALDARVVLSGDRRQHGSVQRGAALRLLEEQAGLVPAEVKDIQRQRGNYKQAVQALSSGRTDEGFKQLDALGWVREVADDDRCRVLAKDYMATIESGKSALVVSPTHREGEDITTQIRKALVECGRLGKSEHRVLRLQNANLTEAERRDEINYFDGDVLEFHQNAKGFERGQRLVAGTAKLPLDQTARFQVYQPGEFSLAAGDVVRITKNGMTADGQHRLNNGARYTVKGFTKSGDIVLENGWKVGRDFGHLDYGYVVTSHASQGKTVDRVLIGQSSDSFPASSREQFYVSVSRGREQATVYTDDKKALLEAVNHSDDRLTATEFVGVKQRTRQATRLQDRQALMSSIPEPPKQAREGVEHER